MALARYSNSLEPLPILSILHLHAFMPTADQNLQHILFDAEGLSPTLLGLLVQCEQGNLVKFP